MTRLLRSFVVATLAATELWIIFIIHDVYWNLPRS